MIKIKIRESFNMTQEEFAKLIKCSVATISRWEHGHYNISPKYMHKILTEAKKKGIKLEFKDFF